MSYFPSIKSTAGLLDWIVTTAVEWQLPAAANLKLAARLIHMQMGKAQQFPVHP